MNDATLCSVEGCSRPTKFHGWCLFHYGRWRKGIPFDRPVRKSRVLPVSSPTCSLDGCDGETISRGWCRFHYERWRKTGNPLPRCTGCGANLGPHHWKWCSQECKITSPLRKEQQQTARKVYDTKHAGAIAARGRISRAKNLERDRTHQKAWRDNHPERVREMINRSIHKRRARMLGRISEPVTIEYLYERDRGRCGICGGKVSLERRWPDPLSPSKDHILPLAKGGDDSRANKQLAHLRCNQRKHDRGTDEQLRLLG